MTVILRILLRIGWLVAAVGGMGLCGLVILKFFSAGLDPDEAASVAQLVGIAGGPMRVAFLGLGLLALGVFLRRLLRRDFQYESDRLAQRILTHLRADQSSPQEFFVYLRAFETTGRLKAPFFSFDMGSFGLMQLHTRELESLIGLALRKAGPLVALGRPGESIGAGRVNVSDEHWMGDIALLARRAKGILLIPSDHAGTVWEMNYLRQQGFLSKTVFLMPPESRRFNWKAHWWEARRAIGTLGAELPEYDETGLLFILGSNGAVRNAEPFLLYQAGSFRKSVLKLLSPGEPGSNVSAAMARAERRAHRQRMWGRMNVVIRMGAGVAFVLATLTSAFLSRASPMAGPATALERLLNSPLYEARIQGLSKEQANAVVGELIGKGLKRLDSAPLVAYFSAYAEILDKGGQETCEAIAIGNVTSEQMEQAIASLSETQRGAFLDAQFTAALAELERMQPPLVSPAEIKETKDRFFGTFTPEELTRFNAANEKGGELSASNACWLLRRLYGGVKALSQPYDGVWAKMLAQNRY